MSGRGPERAKSRGWHGRGAARAKRLLARNSRGRHYSVPPAILLAAATYWPRRHSFPARSANRCISPPIPICHCPNGPSLFSVRATGVPRISPLESLLSTFLRRQSSLFRCFRPPPPTFSSTLFLLPFFPFFHNFLNTRTARENRDKGSIRKVSSRVLRLNTEYTCVERTRAFEYRDGKFC